MNLYFTVKSFTAPSKTCGENRNQNVVAAKKQACKVPEHDLSLFNFWPVEGKECQLRQEKLSVRETLEFRKELTARREL